jgi:RNA polymerase sigma-70 factor, ECF subfamily
MSTSSNPARDVLQRCLETGTDQAWVEFVRLFQPVVARGVFRVMRRYGSSSNSLADDLAQETYIRLCKDNFRALRDFEHRHDEAIFAYIRVVASSVAFDHFRSFSTLKRKGEVADEAAMSNLAVSSGAIEDSARLRELEAFLASTQSERDCAIFWLYYRQGFTARDISNMPQLGLSQKGVESCIFRLTQALRSAVKSARISSTLTKGKPAESTLGVIE